MNIIFNANFTGADLTHADLVGAIVDENALNAAKTLNCAYMPDGSQPLF